MKILCKYHRKGGEEVNKKLKSEKFKYMGLGYSGSLVVKNLPANTGDTGSISDLERSHMPIWSN